MDTVTLQFTGTAPLLVHSDRLVNALDPIVKAKAALTSKRGKNKTEDDIREIARLEWTGGLYFDEKIGPYIPGRNIKAMLISAAKITKDGMRVKRGLIVEEDKVKLLYNGPRDLNGLWADGHFTDLRTVGQMQARIMRCRPVFPEWQLTFTIVFDASVVDKADVLRWCETGGRMVGLGDYRVECCGDFGRFEVEEVA